MQILPYRIPLKSKFPSEFKIELECLKIQFQTVLVIYCCVPATPKLTTSFLFIILQSGLSSGGWLFCSLVLVGVADCRQLAGGWASFLCILRACSSLCHLSCRVAQGSWECKSGSCQGFLKVSFRIGMVSVMSLTCIWLKNITSPAHL